jgi:ankyrin repeat protein
MIYTVADMICPPFSEANSLFHTEDILAICHGLLMLTSTTGKALGLVDQSERETFQIVQLAHFSVKQYLLSSRTVAWHLDGSKAHISIIRASIASYLHAVSFPEDLRNTTLGEVIKKHPLSDYAAEYTTQHLKALAGHHMADLEDSFRLLLDPNKQLLANGLGMLFVCRSFIPITSDGLPAADTFSSDRLSANILDLPDGFDGTGTVDISCLNLCLSARLGLPNVVQWLLTVDSMQQEIDGRFWFVHQFNKYSVGPAITEASGYGHAEIVQILVNAGANVNQEAHFIGPPLIVAAAYGLERAVHILLECGAEVNKSGQLVGSPIQAAALFGHTEIVSILVRAGAEINRVPAHFPSPLYAAAQLNDVELVRLLIDRGAEVNSQFPRYGAPIHVAAERGHQETIQVLLDAGADVNQPGGDYGSALGIASFNGHADVVRVLLKAGADINMPCILKNSGRYGSDVKYFQTQLIFRGNRFIKNLPVMKLVTPKIGYATLAAVQYGHHDIVRILLDAGADVNLVGGYFNQSALYTACLICSVPLIQILLDHGANADQEGGPYGSALQLASSMGATAIVRMLVEAGANVNQAGGYYGSPLQAASYNGFPETVRVILDAGADVNKHGFRFCSALIAASSQGHGEVVELLLDSGAVFTCSSCHAGSAIYEARLGKHEAIVQMLLDAGADPDDTHRDRRENCLQKHYSLIYTTS